MFERVDDRIAGITLPKPHPDDNQQKRDNRQQSENRNRDE
jgi:hypothetical protein